jgi:radical SAM protein with 4Fe4S-binding SPASM domain
MSAPDAKYGELPLETILKIVDELADCGVMSVSLTGGEPLVRSDFPVIIDALLDRGIGIHTIYSNGALISEKFLKQLADRKIRPEINMSFDGVGWHDWMRGIDGAEEAVDRAFRLCRENGFPTGAEMCIHRKNQHTLRESILHLRDVGCRSLKTVPVSDVGAWHTNGQEESVSTEELFQLYLDYLPEYYEDGMPLSIMLGGFFSADPKKPEKYDIPLYHSPQDPEKHCVCGHARMIMYISPEGRALPCMSLSGLDIQERFPLIPEIGLRKCLTDSFYMDFINTRSIKILEHNPQCRECAFASRCHGGCRASGLESAGQKDLYAADPAACLLFKGGWAKRIVQVMKEITDLHR